MKRSAVYTLRAMYLTLKIDRLNKHTKSTNTYVNTYITSMNHGLIQCILRQNSDTVSIIHRVSLIEDFQKSVREVTTTRILSKCDEFYAMPKRRR